MSTPDDELTDKVADAITRCIGVDAPFSQCRPWAVNLLSLIGGNPVTGKQDWRAAMEYFGLGNLFTLAHQPAPGGPPPAEPPPASPSAPLMDYLIEIYATNPPDMPLPANSFVVGMHGNDVWVAQPLRQRMSKGEAINLAVWLLALADPNLRAFGPMFAKVGGF